MVDRLELEARFKDLASGGVKKLGKTLESVRPTNGMAQASKWMGDFRAAADKAGVAVRPLSTGLSAVGIGGLAAGLSMSELVKQFKELADSTLSMKELGRQSRMSATEIARLQYAAGKLHVDPAAMNGAIGSWSSKMLDFRMRTSEFYRYLMRQNADVAAKIEADSPINALKDTLDYISRIKDPQIQKRVADMAGVGDLTAMLGKGPQGLAEAFADAAREVKPVSTELQAAADRFNDSTNRLNQAFTNLKNDIGPSVLDPLSHTVDKLDEALKFAAAYPGDAAAAAATIGGAFAAFWARARIMRGSALAGGGGAMGRAAGEMAGAASQQKLATTTFAEAVAEFRLAVAEMRGKGGLSNGNSGGATPEEQKPSKGGKQPRAGGSLLDLAFELLMLKEAADKAKEVHALEPPKSVGVRGALDFLDPNLGNMVLGRDLHDGRVKDDAYKPALAPMATLSSQSYWARKRAYLASGQSPHPADDDRQTRARTSDMPESFSAHDLFQKVRDGSKEGIVAGLRELAQQDQLGGQGAGGGSFGGAASGHGGHAGMPNLRYGRRPASGGFRHGPGAEGGGPEGAFNPKQPDKPGTYRPQYTLSDADLSDYVVNTVNGEATSSAESIDAVINNMMNRVGSKGWGPSRNLKEVASAPGQYAGHRPASAQVAERIRARIRAIASGGVPDNTNGSNAYRAAWYHGKWGQQHAATGRVVGGNRFDYEPWAKNGPYAPYPAKAGGNPPGAGAPTPSTAAVGDADVFAARQRMLNGGHDPKDRELVDRYKRQQATPPGHRAGGWIKGPGGPTADRIPAMLSNGEFVVQAKAAGQFLPLLHAINDGQMSHFADGGPVGIGVPKQFYPRSSPAISADEGADNRRAWRDFLRRSPKEGGMGASWRTTFGALAMMQGESGRGLNSKLYNWDVNGPSGGIDQLHDVTQGRAAGKLHRLSDLMTLAMQQHVDWKDRTIQQANFRKEATGSMWWAWRKMLAAKSAKGALKEGIDKFENPAQHDLELRRRAPNIVRLQREAVADGAISRHEIDPIEVAIRHHPHTGKPIVTARGGKGTKIGIRTAPTMRPT